MNICADAYMFVYHIHFYCPQRQDEDIRLLRTED